LQGWILKVAVLGATVVANYRAIPSANTELTRFDTLIVLGTPCQANGTSSPEQRERVLEGLREFRAGVAKHIVQHYAGEMKGCWRLTHRGFPKNRWLPPD
jgi:hypothetical protein